MARVRFVLKFNREKSCCECLKIRVTILYGLVYLTSKTLLSIRRKYEKKAKELMKVAECGTKWILVALSTFLLLRTTVASPE